jgi:enamine deaminase RidA (YjgF/YER057c/UK114 family)
MKRTAIAVACLLAAASLSGAARRPGLARERLNPSGLSTPRGYTHVVGVRGGKTVYVSGQVSLDAKGELVGRGDLRAQTKQVFENLKTALAAAGADFTDLVKLNTYVVDYKPEDLNVLREVRGAYLSDVAAPASTLVGVQALAREAFLIEIEAIAVVE